MEHEARHTTVQIGEERILEVYYFFHISDLKPDAGFFRLTAGSDTNEFPPLSQIIPAYLQHDEGTIMEMVNAIVRDYFLTQY